MNTCFCVGPQNGQPLCPCQMRALDDNYFRKEPSKSREIVGNVTFDIFKGERLYREAIKAALSVLDPDGSFEQCGTGVEGFCEMCDPTMLLKKVLQSSDYFDATCLIEEFNEKAKRWKNEHN
jgi:hypothetical protein